MATTPQLDMDDKRLTPKEELEMFIDNQKKLLEENKGIVGNTRIDTFTRSISAVRACGIIDSITLAKIILKTLD